MWRGLKEAKSQNKTFTLNLINMDNNNALWFWTGMGTWLIILLLFLGRGGNNWFGFGNNGNAWAWMMANSNANNNHDNTVDLINNNTMRQNQLFSNQNQANQTSMIQMGFCNVNNNIEKAIQQATQNTCQIIANSTANTQKILDMMCNQETQRLRTELAEQKVIAQNNQQTVDLLSRLQPTPIPSYIVSSPYTSIYPPATTTASNG